MKKTQKSEERRGKERERRERGESGGRNYSA
jgi:hypothetical protein